jgi:uncharacterized protein YegP (UPF0339 family)
MKIEIYTTKSRKPETSFRLVADNGEVTLTPHEAYTRKPDCIRAIQQNLTALVTAMQSEGGLVIVEADGTQHKITLERPFVNAKECVALEEFTFVPDPPEKPKRKRTKVQSGKITKLSPEEMARSRRRERDRTKAHATKKKSPKSTNVLRRARNKAAK